jgi:hypothetical protein
VALESGEEFLAEHLNHVVGQPGDELERMLTSPLDGQLVDLIEPKGETRLGFLDGLPLNLGPEELGEVLPV